MRNYLRSNRIQKHPDVFKKYQLIPKTFQRIFNFPNSIKQLLKKSGNIAKN